MPRPYFRAQLCKLFGKSPQELDLAVPGEADKPIYDPAIPPNLLLLARDQELAWLKEQLSAGGRHDVVALHGLPGVGKTALAVGLAHDQEVRAHFCDGILWAALGPEPSIPTILTRWGDLLGISPERMSHLRSDEDWFFAVADSLGQRRMLVVIDNVWSANDALSCAVGSNCAHLITTRFPGIATDIAGEGATVIRELNEHEGVTLLRMLAPHMDHEEQKVLDLVNAVGGLPLALTLMGKYLYTQAATGQPRRVKDALERLSRAEERLQLHESRGPLDHHSSLPTERDLSLQSVFAVTCQQLDNEARAALSALSVFPPKPNSFSEEAALGVAGCTVNTLDALLDTGLLESSSPGRYMLHPVVADYARVFLA